MLSELHVRDLGVIEDQTLLLGPGMVALTGETGAGKTLVVDALGLLLGGRAESVLVREGASEALVEGRFVDGEGGEVVLTRVVPASGRSRAYVDGRMASGAALAEVADRLIELHGQHAHQALLAGAAQRDALDRAAGVDRTPLSAARAEVQGIDRDLAALGGDERSREREADLLRFQLEELASVEDPDEDGRLQDEEARLADAEALRAAAFATHAALADDDGVVDRLGTLVGLVGPGSALGALGQRLRGLVAEAADVADEARQSAESLEDDPERLAEIGERRRVLADLRRKYGDSLAEVISFRDEAAARLADLLSHGERVRALTTRRETACAAVAAAAAEVGRVRRAGAGPLATAVERELRRLALPRARFVVAVDESDVEGSAVTWLLSANPGEPALPLSKVASGGELSRVMLALRMALGKAAGDGAGGTTMVFDEVDAGIGGETALAVGRSLAALAARPDAQVLVVTHLPQVAALAHRQLAVTKTVRKGRTVSRVDPVAGEERVAELARMLSGRPDSTTARRHAAELLAGAPSPAGRRRSG